MPHSKLTQDGTEIWDSLKDAHLDLLRLWLQPYRGPCDWRGSHGNYCNSKRFLNVQWLKVNSNPNTWWVWDVWHSPTLCPRILLCAALVPNIRGAHCAVPDITQHTLLIRLAHSQDCDRLLIVGFYNTYKNAPFCSSKMVQLKTSSDLQSLACQYQISISGGWIELESLVWILFWIDLSFI